MISPTPTHGEMIMSCRRLLARLLWLEQTDGNGPELQAQLAIVRKTLAGLTESLEGGAINPACYDGTYASCHVPTEADIKLRAREQYERSRIIDLAYD